MSWPTDHPFWSYRLAKFEMAQEKRGLGRLKFAMFERKLDERLAALRSGLSSPDLIFRGVAPGRVRLRPKSVEIAARGDATRSFVRVPERPEDHEFRNLGVRVMIESTPEFATSEAAWIRQYGALMETMLTPMCRANRLDLRGTPPSLSLQGRRLFKYWAPAYAGFRADSLAAARRALRTKGRCCLIVLDLASYYDNIEASFLVADDFIAELVQAARRYGETFSADEYKCATAGLLEAFSRFRADVHRVVGVDSATGIPIGCLTSRLIANLALSKLDYRTASQSAVAFYGRYVDDIILVVDLEDTDITAAVAVIERFLPVDRNRSTDKKIVLDEVLLQRSGSSFAIQHKKLRIFDLRGEEGLEYLGAVKAEMDRASSERRRFLEPAEADRTVAASSNAEPVTALRDADALSLRRLAANTVCSKIVTSAAMLTKDEAAKYSREHLGTVGRLATDWSRWVEMVDVALNVLGAAVTSGDIDTADEVISGLMARVDGLRQDTAVTIRWGSRRLRHDLASELIASWIIAQLRETLAASLPLDSAAAKKLLGAIDALGYARSRSILLTRKKLTKAAHKLATADLRLVDRETDYGLGALPRARSTASLAALTAELVKDTPFAERDVLLRKFICVCGETSDPVFATVDPVDILLMYRPPSFADILLRWLRAEYPLDGLADIVNAVRGTRYWTTPMAAEGGTIHVEHAPGMTIGPSGVGTTRIILGNLCTEDKWWTTSLTVPTRTRERQRRLARVVNNALAAARSSEKKKGAPALLVLPELSLPQQWLRQVVRHLGYNPPFLSLVAGLEYNVVGKTVYNEAVAFIPRPFSTAAGWIWTKGRPADGEGPLLSRNGFKFGTRGKSRRFVVMSTEHGRFAPLICSELLEVDSRARLLDRIDILIVPAWNPDLLTFEYFVHAASLDLHSFVAVANNGIYSDCRVRGPYDEHWRRDACRLTSRGENEIVIADIPVDLLRDFRADPVAYKQKIKSWKEKHPNESNNCPWPGWKPCPPK